MLEFEARCLKVKDDKWHWNVRIYRHGHLKEDFWLKDDYEMEALANEIDKAMIPHKKEEDWDWATEYVKRIAAVVLKNLTEADLQAAAARMGYELVEKGE